MLYSAACHGSGFGVFTQGAAPLGRANAAVAHGDGAYVAYFNPALIHTLPGTRLEAGTTMILPDRNFRGSTGERASTADDPFFPSTLYLTRAFGDDWGAGIGIFSPFGLGTDWGDTWSGRYLATNSELASYAFNPVISHRLLPSLSIGAGVNVVLLDATLESRIPSASLGIPGVPFDIARRFTGSGWGVGYNAALHWKPTERISAGATYRSEVKVDLDGHLTTNASPGRLSGSSSLTLPSQITAGVAWVEPEQYSLEAGMRWEGWSSFRDLTVRTAGAAPESYPRHWHDTFSVNLGGRYRIDDRWGISAGYLYGWNPVPSSTFEPAIPDSNTHLVCIGGDHRFDRLTVSLAYGYQLQETRGKGTNRYGAVANGTYRADLHLLALSLGYAF